MECKCGCKEYTSISNHIVFCNKCKSLYDRTKKRSAIERFLVSQFWPPLKCAVPGCNADMYGYLVGRIGGGYCSAGHLHVYHNDTLLVENSLCCRHRPLKHYFNVENGVLAACEECKAVYEVQRDIKRAKCYSCNSPLYYDLKRESFRLYDPAINILNCRECGQIHQGYEIPFTAIGCWNNSDCHGNYILNEGLRWCSECKKAYYIDKYSNFTPIQCPLCKETALFETKPSIRKIHGTFVFDVSCHHCGFDSTAIENASSGVAEIIRALNDIYINQEPEKVKYRKEMHLKSDLGNIGLTIPGDSEESKLILRAQCFKNNIIRLEKFLKNLNDIEVSVHNIDVDDEQKNIILQQIKHIETAARKSYNLDSYIYLKDKPDCEVASVVRSQYETINFPWHWLY